MLLLRSCPILLCAEHPFGSHGVKSAAPLVMHKSCSIPLQEQFHSVLISSRFPWFTSLTMLFGSVQHKHFVKTLICLCFQSCSFQSCFHFSWFLPLLFHHEFISKLLSKVSGAISKCWLCFALFFWRASTNLILNTESLRLLFSEKSDLFIFNGKQSIEIFV